MKILRALAGLAVFTALALPAVASAHSIEYVAAQTTLRVDGSRILLHSEVPSLITADIESSADEKSYYQDYFERELTIWTADRACKFKLSSLKIGPEAQSTFDGVYTCPAPVRQVTDLKIHSQLYDIFFTNFDHIATVRIGEASWRLTFSPSARDYPGTVQAVAEARSGQSASPWQTFWTVAGQFTGMGAMHIFTGYDHILFLLCVILLMRSWKRIVILLTTFTLAHSVTLILAGLHIITISPRVVEPLIAVSIIYMALRNVQLLRRGEDVTVAPGGRERQLATAGFGLVHGLGFASVLIDAQLPADYLVPSLLFFNVGVELGQLVIVAILLPLLWQLDKLPRRHYVLLGGSLATVALATIWLVQRLL